MEIREENCVLNTNTKHNRMIRWFILRRDTQKVWKVKVEVNRSRYTSIEILYKLFNHKQTS